jgi:hypothetical protein
MKRREFLKAASAASFGARDLRAAVKSVTVVGEFPSGPLAWALAELRRALSERGIPIGPDRTIDATRLSVASLLDLADQIRSTGNFEAPSAAPEPPSANRIRSILKPFVSEVEDKAWFYDKDNWREYLTMLATHRFTRFSLTFGIGYDFTREVRDSYFHFPYPFLVNMPGYQVTVPGIDDRERQLNLDTLRFIGEETVRRGLQFQVGIWTHAYSFEDSPNADRKITGLNPQNHSPYCRDALRAVLEACPTISGLTLRTHGESGVPEESYPFWKTVFEGVTAVKRPIELDLHAKGLDWPMIELTQSTGMPVTISPKYWAEHMGLPYHQTQIRQLEMPQEKPKGDFFALSSGSRSFLRYGYGDLLKEKRTYKVLHRMWPGTQRLLLWGDPVMAAAYSRASSFCGSDGIEICEPLSFKGRKGAGLPGGRTGYAGTTLIPRQDWKKYSYTYRVWGRMLENPDTAPEVLQREPVDQLYQMALASSSRILPLITTAHMPSAANANYWPEIYTNQSIVIDGAKDQYSDTPIPKRFGTVSPLDPGIFSSVDEFVADLLGPQLLAKYSPVEVATWLEELAEDSERRLAAAKPSTPEERRMQIDAAIQNGIGRFFAAKFRSAILLGIYRNTGDENARQEALKQYRKAREAWQDMVNKSKGVYRSDLTFGYAPWLRGHWSDRIEAIDRDIAAMETYKSSAHPTPAPRQIQRALAQRRRNQAPIRHTPLTTFKPGEAITVKADCTSPVTLHYRVVNQAETWRTVELRGSAQIPASYTQTEYPIQYYFEVKAGPANTLLHPGLPKDFSHPPYYIIRQNS